MVTNLTNLPSDFAPNYLLCIAWVDGNHNVYRYAMWRDVGETIYFNLPLYGGQKVGKNFRFEMWSTSSGTSVSQATSLSFDTSVLGNVDYRYGSDFQLVANDPLNTAFANINTPPPLFTTSLVYRWSSDSGVVTAPSSSVLVSWTDSVGGLVFMPTGVVGTVAGTGLVNDPIGVLNAASYVSVAGNGNDTTTVAMVLKLDSLSDSGVIFDNGNGVTLLYNSGSGKLTAYSGITESVLSPVIDTWYIVIMNSNTGTVTIYDTSSGDELDSFTNGTGVGPDATITVGNVFMLIPELLIYNDEILNETLRGYFMGRYFNSMSLPFVFPLTSNMTPNP